MTEGRRKGRKEWRGGSRSEGGREMMEGRWERRNERINERREGWWEGKEEEKKKKEYKGKKV